MKLKLPSLRGTFQTILVCLLAIDSAHAARPHRCNGRIQFTPCPSQNSIAASPAPTDPRARGSFPYAQITDQEFERISAEMGRWRGSVKGSGFVELRLLILRSGKVESTRYMGHLKLKDKSSTFRFHSPMPKGSGWSWRIDTRARPIS